MLVVRRPRYAYHTCEDPLHSVVPGQGPAAVAVTAQVERHGAPAADGKAFAGLRPGVPGLAAAMGKQDRPSVLRPVAVRRERDRLVPTKFQPGRFDHEWNFHLQGA